MSFPLRNACVTSAQHFVYVVDDQDIVEGHLVRGRDGDLT